MAKVDVFKRTYNLVSWDGLRLFSSVLCDCVVRLFCFIMTTEKSPPSATDCY
jgi:hypothetical protein